MEQEQSSLLNPRIALLIVLVCTNLMAGLNACTPEQPKIATTTLVAAFKDAVPPMQETVAKAADLIEKHELPAALSELQPLSSQPLSPEQDAEVKRIIDEIYSKMKEVK